MTQTNYYNLVETPIPKAVRLAILWYVIIYRIITPPASAVLSGEAIDFIFWRATLDGVLELVLIYPILFIRNIGYFNPLALPTFVLIATNVGFAPLHLFLPIFMSSRLFVGDTDSWSLILQSLSTDSYSILRLQFSLYSIVYYASLYIGYLSSVRRKISVRPTPLNNFQRFVPVAAGVIMAFSALATLMLLRSSGGVEAHILAMTRGRYQTLDDAGASIVASQAAVIALWAWAATTEKELTRNLPFALGAIAILPLVWLSGGSRSSIVYALMGLVIIYSIKKGYVPFRLVITGAVVAVALIGMLGSIRRDFGAQQVNTEQLSLSNFGEWIDRASAEVRDRNSEEGDFAAFVAAEVVGLLNGETYFSVVAFPVPRTLWPGKPRPAHAYNTWVAFMGHPLGEEPAAWGIPLGPVAEAYWNFGLAGCVAVGFAVGAIFGRLTAFFRSRPNSAFIAVLYVIFVIYFTGGSREAQYVIQYSATLIAIYAISLFVSLFVPKSPTSGAELGGSVVRR